MAKAAKTTPDRDAIIDALMALAAERPWDDIELSDIVERAGVSLAAFREAFPSKGAVLGAFAKRIDVEVLAGTSDELADEPARERLFDVYMRRIDALTPYKAALKRINVAVRRDPLSLAALNQVALNSQRFMLAAASIPTEDSLGPLRIQGAVLVFANVMETWYDDDSPDLARTMARLDRELKRGERMMERAGDAQRAFAPFKALGDALLDGGRRLRREGLRGARRRRHDEHDEDLGAGEAQDPAAAI